MISQREADIGVLMSIYNRSEGRESARKLYRVKNSLTTGGYMASGQFDKAIRKLQRLRMIELDGSGDDRLVDVSAHGASWLMSNFHWVRGDTATLAPNDDNWTMTPPKGRSLLSIIFGTQN